MKDINTIEEQEQALLAGYRKMPPESKRLFMTTMITAVMAETGVTQQYGLLHTASPAQTRETLSL